MFVGSIEWTPVIVAAISGAFSLASMIVSVLVHRQVKPPSGGKLGNVAERTLALSAVALEHTRRNSGKLDTLQAASDETQGGV